MKYFRLAVGVTSAIALGCGSTPPSVPGPADSPARLMAAAEQLEREDKTRQAFAAYHQLLQKYPDTPEGKQAAERVRQARSQSLAKTRALTPDKRPQ